MDANELRALADALPEGVHWSDPITPEMLAEAIKRFCADAQPVAVPAGWKLVPVEPTPEMLSAVGMMDGYDWHAPGCSPDADHANWYSAMIAAAPAVPQAEPKREDQPLRDLLAIIHCDGGHHTEAVGLDQSIKDAQAAVCELKRELAMAKREPLSDERIAEIQRAAYERAAQVCIEAAAELRRCADGCTDGRYDWKADGALDCADAIRALGGAAMSINDGGPAFPVSTRVEEGAACYGHQDGPATYQFGGMTLRDYFAAKAMQSIVSVLHVGIKPMSLESVASVAYEIADAMLKAREAA